ncbi:hypothetical protein, partial [Cronobacter malonaticus]|uniref:hypothetical protein n=1 Tax=Cronobacter malonaticus TaxID=413503 RepID=UPI001F27DE12
LIIFVGAFGDSMIAKEIQLLYLMCITVTFNSIQQHSTAFNSIQQHSTAFNSIQRHVMTRNGTRQHLTIPSSIHGLY